MTSDKDGSDDRRSLREAAESRVTASRKDVSAMNADQIQDLVHELQVHQIELEIQNEELREAQLALAEARDLYIDLYEFSPTGYLSLDTTGTIISANLTASTMLGVERRDMVGKRLAHFVEPASQDKLYSHIRATRIQPGKHVSEIEMLRANGIRLAVLLESRLRENNPPTIRTTLTEVTKLKLAEEKLESLNETLEEGIAERTIELKRANLSLRAEVAARRSSEEFNRAVIDTARTIILVLDKEGRIVQYNRYLEELSGRKLEDVQGQDWFEVFLPEEDRLRLREMFDVAMKGVQTVGNRNAIITASGTEREIEWYDAILKDPEGEEIGLLSVGQDISNQLLLERELLTVADEEQRRIGQQLHDDIGQELVGLKLRMETLASSLAELAPALLAESQRISDLVDNTIAKVRALSRGLIPVKVSGREMLTSLSELAQQICEVQGIDCQFLHGPGLEDLDTDTATQLFHIVQEAVTNAIKHAEAQRIQISVESEDNIVEMVVRDEGKGFKLADDMQGSGLKIMEHRAARIGGSLIVQSIPGDGTVIRCRVPRGSKGGPFRA